MFVGVKVGDKLCSDQVVADKRSPEAEVTKVDYPLVTFRWLPNTLIGKRYEESGQPDKEITINWNQEHHWMVLERQ